jgi:hypothetical protein
MAPTSCCSYLQNFVTTGGTVGHRLLSALQKYSYPVSRDSCGRKSTALSTISHAISYWTVSSWNQLLSANWQNLGKVSLLAAISTCKPWEPHTYVYETHLWWCCEAETCRKWTNTTSSSSPGATQPIVGLYFTALYRALASSRTRLLDHAQRRATVGRTPLNEW